LLRIASNFSIPGPIGERIWERDFSDVLPAGYSRFRGHWSDYDIAAKIFSFQCAPDTNGSVVLQAMQQRLTNFNVYESNTTEVVLRRTVIYSSPGGFDEWRFLYDKKSHRVYALFANLDSDAELRLHGDLLQRLRGYARDSA
jgi:hypothetical protein